MSSQLLVDTQYRLWQFYIKKNNTCVLLFCVFLLLFAKNQFYNFTRAINEAENDIHFWKYLNLVEGT